MKNLKITIRPRTSKIEFPENLGFGQMFSDHIFEMDYSPELGWHNLEIKPLDNMSMHPATMFIHYGQALFEGLKAFRTVNDEIMVFRPDKHFERFNNSARRLCMPTVDVQLMIDALKELIQIDKDFIPTRAGEALYIRPMMFGTDEVLGVKPSKTYKVMILLSPVGAYYPEGFKPVRILVQDDYVRAVRKGMGECKTPGNYAASLLAGELARKEGFSQVLWLDAIEQKYIEEVGTMNIFISFKNEIATPKLTGGILPGITRMSVIQLLRDWGHTVNERLISVQELIDEYEDGNLTGVFGTGTAAIISSVSELGYKGKALRINNGEPSELAVKLFNHITSLHYGKVPDKYNWLQPVTSEVVVA